MSLTRAQLEARLREGELLRDLSLRGVDLAGLRLRGAIVENSIYDHMLRAEAYLNEDGSRVVCDACLIPMGGGQDSVEELAWVPRAWRSKSHS